jgi:linoleoyl-CoA desaturase
MKPPKFLVPSNSFFAELRKRINQHFVEIKSKPTGNIHLYIKAMILIISFTGLYTHLVFFTSGYVYISLLECMILGALTSAIGFNIMHDGAHGSFSKKMWLNELAGLSLNMFGANVFMWKTKHNVVHHTYTNIEGMDDDINAKPFLRLCDTQKKYKIHRFQHLYFWMVYSFLYLYWIFFTDYKKYFTQKVGDIPIKKMVLSDHLSFWAFKLTHLILFITIPIYMVGIIPWIIGFLTYALFTGFVLSLVFQLAHTDEDTHFPGVNVTTGVLEDEWAVHQLKTTANFATKNKIVSWFTGGLNFQIEHHLFPHISHIHYPAISGIVKQVCLEYNITYIEFPKVRFAVASHILHLKQMGMK